MKRNIYVVTPVGHEDIYGAFATLSGAVGMVAEIMAEHNTTGFEVNPSGEVDTVWYATFNDTGETWKIQEIELED